jgi:transposase
MEIPEGYILIKKEEYQALLDKIDQLTRRIKELEERLSQNSQNSSKPPSTDGYNKVIKNNREKSDRKQGAQEGHKGNTLHLVESPDRIIEHKVEGICSCGQNLSELSITKRLRRQVYDLPEKLIEVTEHQVEVKICRCGKIHYGQCQYEATVQYGSKIKAMLVYLNQYQYIPFERVQEFFEDCIGISISDGVIEQANELCYEQLQGTEEQIKQILAQSEVLHNDETGIRCEKKLQWVHNSSTKTYTHYSIQSKRGKKGINQIGILPDYKGISVHDRYASYDEYTCKHSFCNAHLLRELKFLYEENGKTWAGKMIALLVKANNYKKEEQLDSMRLKTIEQEYNHIVEIGLQEEPPHIVDLKKKRGRVAKTKSLRLLEVFKDRQQEVMRFAYNKEVPFDNNQAERDLRMVKLKQKISGCFRTKHGAEVFFRIRSYISTVKKQGNKILDAIEKSIIGHPLIFNSC